jgi:hypothetical protein
MTTTTVKFSCPHGSCRKRHSAVVRSSGHDRATTSCAGCANNVAVKTRDGSIVETEVL